MRPVMFLLTLGAVLWIGLDAPETKGLGWLFFGTTCAAVCLLLPWIRDRRQQPWQPQT